MPNPIKAFFDKKKAEARFKMAGPGQKLGDSSKAAQDAEARRQQALAARDKQGASGSASKGPTAAQRQAADAALARLDQDQQKATDFNKSRSRAAIRAQALKRIEQEKKTDQEIAKLKETYGEKPLLDLDGASPLVCSGVYFKCPLIGPDVLPKAEMKQKIRDFLYGQLEMEERGLTACLIIRTMGKEEGKTCVETLCKYLENILLNPTEEKYRKIRKSNKAYQERVACTDGHTHFLEACGFETAVIDDQEYYIFPESKVNDEQLETMQTLKDALLSCEPIIAELDRGTKVLLSSQSSSKINLPQDFFTMGAEELRKEQQLLSEAAEREGMLRTKAMREREAQKERRRYRYTLIRVRFPDGIVLQGTFSVYETYRSVHDFVTEALEMPLPFVLYETSRGQRLEVTDYDVTLSDLDLTPTALLTFAWHPEVADEVKAQLGSNPPTYLNAETMSLSQPNA